MFGVVSNLRSKKTFPPWLFIFPAPLVQNPKAGLSRTLTSLQFPKPYHHVRHLRRIRQLMNLLRVQGLFGMECKGLRTPRGVLDK